MLHGWWLILLVSLPLRPSSLRVRALLRIERVENMEQPDIIRLFHEARNQDYPALADRYRKLKGRRPRLGDELARLGRELSRVSEIDFFEAPGRRDVDRIREVVEPRTTARSRPAAAAPPLDLAALKGRRWVTRPRPHVDRIASAWLIKRFVDPEAEFAFAPPDQLPADTIPFDMAGVELGHQGGRLQDGQAMTGGPPR